MTVVCNPGRERRWPIRGRDDELELFGRLIARLRDGQGGAVVVEGAAGSGKTRLLEAACAMARRSGVRALSGAGEPRSRMMPFAALLDTNLPDSECVLDTDTVRSRRGSPDARFWLMEDLRERLEHAALSRPLVIAIDDAQWVDDATDFALRSLPRQLASHAILWVLASRSGPSGTTIERMRGSGSHVIVLDRLPDSAVARLAQDILGCAPEPALLELLAAAEGQPLMVVDLLRGLQEDELIHLEDGAAHLARRRLPGRFRDSVIRQMEKLTPEARELLQLASVFGRRVSLTHLSMLVERPPAALLAPVDEALRLEFLVEHDDDLAFRHDLVREVVDGSLPRALRRTMRRRAVMLMMQDDVPPREVVHSLLEVVEPGDREAVEVLRAAASELAAHAPAQAAVVIRRAVEVTPLDDPERPELLREAIPLLFAAGHAAEAKALGQAILDDDLSPEMEAAVRLDLARICLQYDHGEVIRQCRRALSIQGVPARTRLHLRIVLAQGVLLDGPWEEPCRSMAGDLAQARDAEDTAAEAAALLVCGALSVRVHDFTAALRYGEECEALVSRGDPQARQLFSDPSIAVAWLQHHVGHPERAIERSVSGLTLAQREGRGTDVAWWLMVRTTALFALGRLADARAEAEAALEALEDLGPGGAETARMTLGRIAIHTGDRAGMRLAAVAAREMREQSSLGLRRQGEWLAALLAAARGQAAEAVEILGDTLRELGRPTPSLEQAVEPMQMLVLLRVTLAAGATDSARRVVEETERRERLNPTFPLMALIARHARGLLEGDARAMFASIAEVDLVPGSLDRAAILEDAALILIETCDEVARGVEILDRALLLFEAAGAERDAARIRGHLRRLGERRRPRRREPDSGWAGLTVSELAVVRLVAGGATNRQAAEALFLSPHTVSSHLRHAFAKFGINSRVELAAAYARHERASEAAGPGRIAVPEMP